MPINEIIYFLFSGRRNVTSNVGLNARKHDFTLKKAQPLNTSSTVKCATILKRNFLHKTISW